MKRPSGRWGGFVRLVYPLIIVSFPAFCVRPALAQEHDEALKQRFLKEAPARWAEYLRDTEMLQGKITYRTLESLIGQDLQHFEYKTNGKGRVIACESTALKERKQNSFDKEIFGANPRYAFHLRRTTPDAPWTVIELLDLSKGSLPRGWTLRFDQVFAVDARVLVHFLGQRLADVVQSQTFHIKRCASLQRDGEELVEVSFTYERDSTPGARPGLYEGTMLFDPKRAWCLRATEYTLKLKNGDRYRMLNNRDRLIELAEVAGSVTVPKVRESQGDYFRDADQKDRLVNRTEYDLEIPRRLPADEEFTLSAFGLPEPPGLEWKRPTRWYLWLGLAGIACLGLGVALKKVRARARASPGGAG